MTGSPKLKGRHPLRQKDLDRYNDGVRATFGIDAVPSQGKHLVEVARADPYEVVLVDGKVHLIVSGPGLGGPLPTLRALMADRPERAWVTVDMGAVPFLRNGADVMSPGIRAADPAISPGDLVWVRDEKHGMPLALGRALLTGEEMVAATKGKAIETVHYVGDELWQIGSE